VLTGGASFFGVQDPSPAFELAKSHMTTDVSRRANEGYFCLLQVEGEGYNGMHAEAKLIQAVVVPTATTVDGNVNDMVNIVRCELPRGMQQHVKQRKEGELQVRGCAHPSFLPISIATHLSSPCTTSHSLSSSTPHPHFLPIYPLSVWQSHLTPSPSHAAAGAILRESARVPVAGAELQPAHRSAHHGLPELPGGHGHH
jgi:hypothetical protein